MGKKESLEIDVENGPTSEAVKEIENAMKVVEEVAATGSSSTGSSSTGGVTGATGGAATGSATGGATGGVTGGATGGATSGATGSDDATGLNGKFLRRRR